MADELLDTYIRQLYHFFRDELKVQFMQFIPIVERATMETLPLANEGWSERPGGARPLYTQIGKLVTDRSVLSNRDSITYAPVTSFSSTTSTG